MFLDGNPYTVATKKDLARGHLVYHVSGVAAPDPTIAAMTGDVLQNLRSALDHLAYRLVAVGLGGAPADPRFIAYPVCETATSYPALRDYRLKGARPEAMAAVDATKPYKGGNDGLWRIHHLNIVDKHRLLITVGSAFRSLDLGGFGIRLAAKAAPDSMSLTW